MSYPNRIKDIRFKIFKLSDKIYFTKGEHATLLATYPEIAIVTTKTKEYYKLYRRKTELEGVDFTSQLTQLQDNLTSINKKIDIINSNIYDSPSNKIEVILNYLLKDKRNELLNQKNELLQQIQDIQQRNVDISTLIQNKEAQLTTLYDEIMTYLNAWGVSFPTIGVD